MTLIAGQLDCSTNTKNVGFGACFLDWKIIKGMFLYDNPRTFTPKEIEVILATLQADASADIKANRMYPINNFVAPTDNSEAVIVETFDYGSRQITRDGFNDWSWQYVDGGSCLSSSLRTHNGPAYVLLYDKNNKIMGYNSSNGFSTIPLEFFYAEPFKLATGANVAKYMVRIVFDPKYSNEYVGAISAGVDLSQVEGLEDVNIVVNSWDQNTGIANVTLQTSCGSINLFTQYKAQITPSVFLASDDIGDAIPVASVAPVNTNQTFNITLSHVHLPDNGIVSLSGVIVSELNTAGIVGYEIGAAQLAVHGSY